MPTYEYACKACGKKFTLIMGVAAHEKKRPRCPKCGSGGVSQQFSGFFSKTARKS